ncbi:MAG: septum formation initiator family protein [Lachnospiraceae bacterium]|nr:septum formation initiator family protein [Lachnospiraceae bacterium]
MAGKRVVRKKRPKRLLGLIILVICVTGICSYLYYRQMKLQKQYDELVAEKARLEILLKEEEKRADALDDYKAYVQTKDYVEKVARDVLGLVYEDEVIFRPSEEN